MVINKANLFPDDREALAEVRDDGAVHPDGGLDHLLPVAGPVDDGGPALDDQLALGGVLDGKVQFLKKVQFEFFGYFFLILVLV